MTYISIQKFTDAIIVILLELENETYELLIKIQIEETNMEALVFS